MSIEIRGKYLFENGEKFQIKGISYGNFDPADTKNGTFFFDQERTKNDFKLIREANINSIRLYQKPPEYLMQEAQKAGLKVILTLFVDYASKEINFRDAATIKLYKELTKDLVNFGKKYDNTILYLLGTEIPAMSLEQKGISEIENFIKKQGQDNFEKFIYEMHRSAKETDPNCLTSYSNFPPTDFLNLSFLDIITFDIYLHTEKELKSYLAKLQNYSGMKPFLIGELGFDALKEGEQFQADTLKWSIESANMSGCCGTVVFTFADGWWSGEKVIGWEMGIVSENRIPKLAYTTVKEEFGNKELPKNLPFVSVVVASYNEEKYIYKCLNALMAIHYPKDKLEIIVVSDGSKDRTVEFTKKYPVKLIDLVTNKGLSYARNAGAKVAKGEIIAYTDADCEPDPDWLYFLVQGFDNEKVGCVGGPNITHPDDPFIGRCTAQAPGAPTHVLIDDITADHVPGCNMAFRKEVLEKIGGFDEIFRIAGDDVDIEWTLQKEGYTVRYNPAAQVFHHRRSFIKSYIKQQINYGIGEAFVKQRHPERYKGFYNAIWKGRIYNTYNNSANNLLTLFSSPVIYFDWFPVLYRAEPNYLMQFPLDILWHMAWIILLLLTPVSIYFTIIGLLMLSISIIMCLLSGKFSVHRKHISKIYAIKEFFLISYLSFIWSFVRKYGQIKGSLFVWLGRDTRGIKIV